MDTEEIQEVYGDREFTFGVALDALRAGGHLTRQGWNGKGQYIALQRPDAGSKMGLEYLYIHTVQGVNVPWLASQTDLLSDDWVLSDDWALVERTVAHGSWRSQERHYVVYLTTGLQRVYVRGSICAEGVATKVTGITGDQESAERMNLFEAQKILAGDHEGVIIRVEGGKCS